MAKVLQLSKFYYPTFGGVELVAEQITWAHRENCDEVLIVAFGKQNCQYKGIFGEDVMQINTDVFYASTPINVFSIHRILKVIRDYSPDTIYVHLPNPFMHELLLLCNMMLGKKNVKTIGVYHSDIVNQKYLGPLYSFYFSKTLFRYDEIICSSKNLWNSSPVLKKVPIEKQKILPYCIKELGVKEKNSEAFNFKIVAVGRLVPYKGFEYLIRAVRNTKYELVIIGDGPEMERFKKIKSSNVQLVGEVSDQQKARYLSEAGVLALPSLNRSEAYGLVIVEAFSIGLPVIASNIDSGVTFLVKEKERGLLCKPKDPQDILDKLNFLSQNHELYKKMSHNCYSFYSKHLTTTAFKDNLLKRKNTEITA